MVICLLGKTGSGKSLIERELRKHGYNAVISYTTRPMRECEKQGVDYQFLNAEEFEQLIKDGKLFEYTEFNNYLYGSPRLDRHKDYVVVVESAGLTSYRSYFGVEQVIGVYIDVPDDVSNDRVSKRSKITEEQMQSRKIADSISVSSGRHIADLVLDGLEDIDKSVNEILNFVSKFRQ